MCVCEGGRILTQIRNRCVSMCEGGGRILAQIQNRCVSRRNKAYNGYVS